MATGDNERQRPQAVAGQARYRPKVARGCPAGRQKDADRIHYVVKGHKNRDGGRRREPTRPHWPAADVVSRWARVQKVAMESAGSTLLGGATSWASFAHANLSRALPLPQHKGKNLFFAFAYNDAWRAHCGGNCSTPSTGLLTFTNDCGGSDESLIVRLRLSSNALRLRRIDL